MDAPSSPLSDDRHWSLESLNKAYQRGYMAGLTGQSATTQLQEADVLTAAWEAGWVDGHEQMLRQQRSA
ncbi:MAG: ribosome modulation factor [Gammaproteobacteria bacterium]|jgi:ribosome modulation factor|nr:ribosome modulation factor [Gammaproteobacteria bacterium]MBU1491950.1 ribosome modulation factor [Gammaproteobacteria bacterium]MBU2065763.1 ribosome modulation factor [Gammaproteobacteria bacterium]MBU2140552.1 ribosome modulation factor [Gammaproteobacteria bacterium]MBU2216467.1 ribosome modulation factor [Gammaproteobacteria bacterium]